MMRVSAPVLLWAHVCFYWQAENQEKRGRRSGGDGGRAGGRRRRGDAQQLTAGIMGVVQSAAWFSSWSSERRVCICASHWVWSVCVCVEERWHHERWQVRAVDHKWGHWLTACLCGRARPNLSSLTLSDFKLLLTLMDTMSYFSATLGCCIIKCQRTITHHLDWEFIVCGK